MRCLEQQEIMSCHGKERQGRGMFRAANNAATWHCLKMSNICVLPELPRAS